MVLSVLFWWNAAFFGEACRHDDYKPKTHKSAEYGPQRQLQKKDVVQWLN
jgi:hypothetical protein